MLELSEIMKFKLLAAIFVFTLFFSCTTTKIESKFSPVFVTNSSKYELLPPTAMSGSIEELQRMEAFFGKNHIEADIYVIANEDQLSMILMSEFGTTVASLFYDDENLDFESTLFPKKFKPEYIVADFQFCLYDEEILKPRLEEIGLELKVSSEAGKDGTFTETRILSQKYKIISKVTKKFEKNSETGADELKSIKYENFLRGYSYELTGVSE
ncbi:DUF3261 domain-containing protein [Treponema ruminis]|nr:DUF3261 domain-containing protein [Treponema ruminis]